MNQRVIQKDITIGGRRYRLNKTDAREACWLFTTLAAKADGQLLNALGRCSRQEFDEIQAIALKLTRLLDTRDDKTLEVPLFVESKWADKDLEKNPAEVFRLMTESILFNVESFLENDKSSSQS